MGDSPFISLFSALPLFVILFSIWMAVLAWRTRRRTVRRIVAILIIFMGVLIIFTPYGAFFSLGGGALIAVLGIVLLFMSRSSDGDEER